MFVFLLAACAPEIAQREQLGHSFLTRLQTLESGLNDLDRVAVLHIDRSEDFTNLFGREDAVAFRKNVIILGLALLKKFLHSLAGCHHSPWRGHLRGLE